MEKMLVILFLILFFGRLVWRFVLQRINIGLLKLNGKEIPPVFSGEIDEGTLGKMVDYTADQSRLETKENLAGDFIDLAVLFLLLPVLTAWLTGLGVHVILQGLIFFAMLAVISAVASLPFD